MCGMRMMKTDLLCDATSRHYTLQSKGFHSYVTYTVTKRDNEKKIIITRKTTSLSLVY